MGTMTRKLTPVTLPPGRFSLATSPKLTGSEPVVNTIGIVLVAALAEMVDQILPPVTNTTTCRLTRSAASEGASCLVPVPSGIRSRRSGLPRNRHPATPAETLPRDANRHRQIVHSRCRSQALPVAAPAPRPATLPPRQAPC